MENSEKKLLEAIKRSDLDAFKDFFERHYSNCYHYALRFVSDNENARDLVQDSYVSFWENRKKIRSAVSGKALLFKILKNHCLNHVKREEVKTKYNDRSLLEIKKMELNYHDALNPVFAKIREDELQKRLDEALNQLPQDRKRIFELSRFEGLKNAEIAKKLNLSVRTVDTQIYRAVKALKGHLKELF